ncbi:MAG: Peptide deformylase 2 [Chloroflexi bacterium]|nr:Peptide deformylase 2 [Chloroflexota bacterium]
MTKREIITVPHPTLRKKAAKVTDFNDELQELVEDMVESMREDNGVGLAAPQINISQQVITIEFGNEEDESIPPTLYVVVNPKITSRSQEKDVGVEGCLSVPGWMGEVERPVSVRIEGQTQKGEPFKMRARGWLARIFQHEIDHLNGIVFTDRADEVWEPEGEVVDLV